MYYTSTEADGRSNGLVNYALGAARVSFLRSGAIAMFISVDRETHVSGAIIGDNYGYTAFRNGQGAFEARASRVVNGDGPEDDRVRLTWNVLHPSPITWYSPITGSDEVDLEYGRLYEVGFTWGRPDNDFELWVDGELAGSFDLPPGVELSWIASGSHSYIVHRSVDMKLWETFGEELSGETGERLVVTEAFDANTPDEVFYRLEVLPGGGS